MFHVKQSAGEGLARYGDLIRRYHRTLDLMSERAVADLETKLLEGAAFAAFIAPHLFPGDTLLDLGSGVGLPGVPLALSLPDHPITLVERRQKRASFLRIVVSQLGLRNVEVRAEDVRQLRGEFRWITALAVGRFDHLYCLSRHLHAERVTLVSRRGEEFEAEVEALGAAVGISPTVRTAALPAHGRLVALELVGGRPCRSSG